MTAIAIQMPSVTAPLFQEGQRCRYLHARFRAVTCTPDSEQLLARPTRAVTCTPDSGSAPGLRYCRTWHFDLAFPASAGAPRLVHTGQLVVDVGATFPLYVAFKIATE
jgi:hypothetical protein